MSHKNKVVLALGTTLLLASSAQATLKSEKVILNPNMTLTYTQSQKNVEKIEDLFSQGEFYGRLRTNIFKWNWNEESDKLKNNYAMGVGGSIVYKSAKYKGISFTSGLYTSQNPSFYNMDREDVGYIKSGKDVLDRYKTSQTGDFGMTVLGQAYIEYDFNTFSFKAGRQLFESTFTSSNDSKMIPNTFDGLTANTTYLPKTKLEFAYLTKQKLRDHTEAHDVIAYDPANHWSQNDDSGVNRNLTTQRVGTNNKLIIGMMQTKAIKNHKITLSVLNVPSILTQVVAESSYTFRYRDIKIIPAFKYMKQFDNLNADYGVANLKADEDGYTNPNSLDGSMLALKLDIKKGAFSTRIGYSKIADDADIVAPWKAKPTGGYTRAMSQVNWYANTKTYMIQFAYDFSKAKMVDGLSVMARYAIQDFDDNKAGVQADTDVLHIDIRQNIGTNLEAKVRLGFVTDEDDAGKSDVSYNEYRVELNYFF